MTMVAFVVAFVVGAMIAWFVRGAVDKAIVEITMRALVSIVGKKRVAEEMLKLETEEGKS